MTLISHTVPLFTRSSQISILQRLPWHRLSVHTTNENELITAISLQIES